MTRVLVNDTLRSMLLDFSQTLVLCDESGRLLARVTPLPDVSPEDREPRISQEEIRRRKQAKEKSFTTAEVLARLEKL